jgi:hypothetical protein
MELSRPKMAANQMKPSQLSDWGEIPGTMATATYKATELISHFIKNFGIFIPFF